mgnify:CR=1 FL=1
MSGFDYTTIIGRDPKLWRWHVDNVLRNAGLLRDKWNFNVIVYHDEELRKSGVTDELVSICEENDISFQLHQEPNKPFIQRLYDCWNMVQEIGKRPHTLRAGSDQAWSKDSFIYMNAALESCVFDCILQAQTVESLLAKKSRHFMKDFGATPDTFNEEAFAVFCEEISRDGLFNIKDALKEWGHPTSFSSSLGTPHNRTDGCSWLQSKATFAKHGPMPYMEGQWTGDVIIHDRYERAGIPNLLVGNVITYHLVRGESR